MVREPVAIEMGEELPARCRSTSSCGGATSRTRSGTFPHSKEYIEEAFAGLDDEPPAQILVGNAAEHLGLDLDADITETPVAA